MVGLVAGAVAEVGNEPVFVHRAGDNHRAVARGVEPGAEWIGIGFAVIARSDDDDHASRGRPRHRRNEAAGGRLPAER